MIAHRLVDIKLNKLVRSIMIIRDANANRSSMLLGSIESERDIKIKELIPSSCSPVLTREENLPNRF